MSDVPRLIRRLVLLVAIVLAPLLGAPRVAADSSFQTWDFTFVIFDYSVVHMSCGVDGNCVGQNDDPSSN